MTLVRWHPWREVDTLQRQLNRLFDDALTPDSWTDFNGLTRIPAAELEETPDAVHLRLEIPGMDAKDLDVEVTENTVSIRGERKSETKSEESGTIRSEFHYGKFQRLIPLPARIQNTKVEAEYKDGILNLTLPKTEAAQNKMVKLNLSQAAA
ncbi:MAG: Hsp20/alpha crystallin family protein [Cyanothece sp. SIO1E1]|nr:Hsp20/alpha crystallin family protein [Cyanothece sp. SIO1E1]